MQAENVHFADAHLLRGTINQSNPLLFGGLVDFCIHLPDQFPPNTSEGGFGVVFFFLEGFGLFFFWLFF